MTKKELEEIIKLAVKRSFTLYGQVSIRGFILPGQTVSYKPKVTKERNINRSRRAKKRKKPLNLLRMNISNGPLRVLPPKRKM